MRFPRESRLVTKHDFKFVFDKPQKIYSPHLTILYRTNTLPHPRLGIVVAKRLLRSAVDRNRIRRIIRESFRQHQADITSVDVVVLLRSVVGKADSQILREEIANTWQVLTR